MLYNIDYLCVDTYFRSFMDVEGFVPIAFVANYPNVACYGASITDMMDKLSQSPNGLIEVDFVNETIRLKHNWEMVKLNQNFIEL